MAKEKVEKPQSLEKTLWAAADKLIGAVMPHDYMKMVLGLIFLNIETFVDDGYSGTNFKRPDFQRLMQKVENGEVGTIIVKICQDTVKDIFNLCMQGFRPTQIARILNERKVETPICHYDKLGIKHPAKSAIPELWCSDTIKNILSNPHYTGCTVNFRTTKKSYKNKKKLRNDSSKWVIFEGTQEAIVDKQTYEIVQKIREGRRRPTPMGEMNVFSGMVYCADCGKKMYLCRCSTMKQKEYFNCSSYRKQKKSTCSSHHITVEAIEEIVLSYLKRVSDFVIDYEKEFIEVAIKHSRMLSKKKSQRKRNGYPKPKIKTTT